MALSKKAKKYILKHKGKKSASELAAHLNTSEKEVQVFLDANTIELPIKKKILFYGITLSIPVLFFALVEITLRSVNYLGNTDLFIDPGIPGNAYLVPNPNFAARYFFYTRTIPSPSIDVFLKHKPENGFRVFAMGGSSTAGYPYGFNGTFSRVVDDILSDALPDREVEVVNVATSAISTYTLADQVDEIIEQNPDAILIYAGHNEFYGALGIGSNENIGAFPGFVRFYLKLQRFKTFLLLRDWMTDVSIWMGEVFGNTERVSGTLMERIIKSQAIGLNSTEFDLAMRQFESNMSVIARKFGEKNIPVYVATLASNIKDQPPFVSVADGNPPADSVFQRATLLLQNKEYARAKQQFVWAKDLDGLKFRAPSQINEIIRSLPETFSHVHTVPVLDALEAATETGIIGDDLMLEHLHPNQKGYFIIGKTFAEHVLNDLEKSFTTQPVDISTDYYYRNMRLSEFDHAIAHHRVKTLKQGFPFQERETELYQFSYRPANVPDSLAFLTVHKNKPWDEAKVELADYYERNHAYDKALTEYMGLMRNQPWNNSPYIFAARIHLARNNNDEAYPLLQKAYTLWPEDAFTTKMLGALELEKGNTQKAIQLLEESRALKPRDPQTLYNLSGAYGKSQDFEKALELADLTMEINPSFPGIQGWRAQLISIINSRKTN